MTQDAVVTKLLANGFAEVAVARGTACGSNCDNCEACKFQNEIKVTAKNLINAQPGAKVVIESSTKKVYKAIFLVYVLPVVLMMIGYAAAALLGASEGIAIIASFAGLIIGGFLIVDVWKHKKASEQISFEIIQFREDREK